MDQLISILVFRIALLVARFLDTVINDFNAYNLTNGVETDPQSQRRSSLAIPAEAFAQSAVQPAVTIMYWLFHKK